MVDTPVAKLKERPHEIYVTSHGWHTGIVIEQTAIAQRIPELSQRFSAYRYLEIGWGDAGFYQADDISLGLALKALLTVTPSVVHVVGFNEPPAQYFSSSQVVPLQLTQQGYDQLLLFLSRSFKRSKIQRVIVNRQGIYGDSQFYQGIGQYYLTNTCNVWTAKALASAGIDISPLLKLTASSVMQAIGPEAPSESVERNR